MAIRLNVAKIALLQSAVDASITRVGDALKAGEGDITSSAKSLISLDEIATDLSAEVKRLTANPPKKKGRKPRVVTCGKVTDGTGPVGR